MSAVFFRASGRARATMSVSFPGGPHPRTGAKGKATAAAYGALRFGVKLNEKCSDLPAKTDETKIDEMIKNLNLIFESESTIFVDMEVFSFDKKDFNKYFKELQEARNTYKASASPKTVDIKLFIEYTENRRSSAVRKKIKDLEVSITATAYEKFFIAENDKRVVTWQQLADKTADDAYNFGKTYYGDHGAHPIVADEPDASADTAPGQNSPDATVVKVGSPEDRAIGTAEECVNFYTALKVADLIMRFVVDDEFEQYDVLGKIANIIYNSYDTDTEKYNTDDAVKSQEFKEAEIEISRVYDLRNHHASKATYPAYKLTKDEIITVIKESAHFSDYSSGFLTPRQGVDHTDDAVLKYWRNTLFKKLPPHALSTKAYSVIYFHERKKNDDGDYLTTSEHASVLPDWEDFKSQFADVTNTLMEIYHKRLAAKTHT
jgi:hypothetical protein